MYISGLIAKQKHVARPSIITQTAQTAQTAGLLDTAPNYADIKARICIK